jgi:hypothetical protein
MMPQHSVKLDQDYVPTKQLSQLGQHLDNATTENKYKKWARRQKRSKHTHTQLNTKNMESVAKQKSMMENNVTIEREEKLWTENLIPAAAI